MITMVSGAPCTWPRITRQQPSCRFDPAIPPIVKVASGDTIVVETHCCSKESVSQSLLTTPERFYQDLGYYRGNTLSGPIAVQDAQPGDILAVDVLDIQVASSGWTMSLKDRGILGHRLEVGESRVIPIENGEAFFREDVRIPIKPMIGCIGVTPSEALERTGLPGPYYGNADCKVLTAGSSLFLPVLIPGAHLVLGDLHAVQGDGEMGCAGLEIAGDVTLRLRLLHEVSLPLPSVRHSGFFSTICSDTDLYLAGVGAASKMADFLMAYAGVSLSEANMLISMCADLRICQVVNNPVMTCRVDLPELLFRQIGIDLDGLTGKQNWPMNTQT